MDISQYRLRRVGPWDGSRATYELARPSASGIEEILPATSPQELLPDQMRRMGAARLLMDRATYNWRGGTGMWCTLQDPVPLLRKTLPAEVASQVADALALIPLANVGSSGRTVQERRNYDPGGLRLRGEPIELPTRFYSAPVTPNAAAGLSSESKLALACFYTRHNSGFVRHEALNVLLSSKAWWTVPFVVQLLGEYVIEISSDIAEYVSETLPNRPSMQQEYKRFFAENPDFIELTKARATSYWNEYFRRLFPHREDYPAFRALEILSENASRPHIGLNSG